MPGTDSEDRKVVYDPDQVRAVIHPPNPAGAAEAVPPAPAPAPSVDTARVSNAIQRCRGLLGWVVALLALLVITQIPGCWIDVQKISECSQLEKNLYGVTVCY